MNDTTLPKPKTKPSQGRSRNKKALRRGFALHDWKRLLQSSTDLAQRRGRPLRAITPTEIRSHAKVHDGWISLHGKVYNVGPYLHYHPGGVEVMEQCLGGDASALFDKYHRWVNIENLIGPLLLGYLQPEKKIDADDKDADSIVIPTALTKTANGAVQVSELSMPPPRIGIGRSTTASRQTQQIIPPSLLPSKKDVGDDDDDDDEEVDLNPWEKK